MVFCWPFLLSLASAKRFSEFGQSSIPFVHKFSKLAAGTNGTLACDFLASTLVGHISIGTPPQALTVLFDTGSALFWVRSTKCTTQACTGKTAYSETVSTTAAAAATARTESIRYGDGTRVTCTVSEDSMLLAGIAVPRQPICQATQITTTTAETDGIVGLGPPNGRVSSADIQAGLRANNISTVSFWYNKNQKVTSEGSSGEITFGPPLPQRYNGSFQYAPLVADRSHWNIQIQNILLADGTQTMTAPITTIVDTGTTLVSLESSLFQKINQQMGGSPDRSGVYLVDCQKAKTLKPLVFQLTKDTNLTLTWDQQILVVKAQGLCVSIFQPSDSTGITNIIGATFLANFYTVFDYTNERIGFATPTGQGVLSLPNNFAVGKSANMLVNVMLSILLMSI